MNGFDAAIMAALNAFARKNWLFDQGVSFLSENSLLKGGLLAALLWWFWFKADVDDEFRKRVVATIVASFAAILLARLLALSLPFRARPMNAAGLHFLLPFGANGRLLEKWSSFPSDHAAMFFGFSTGLFFISRRVGAAAFAYSLVVICLPRLYLGIHYPTDIVVGSLLGASVSWCVHGTRAYVAVAQPALAWLRRHPTSFYAVFFLVTYQIADMFDGVRALGHALVHVVRYSAGRLV